MMFSVKINILLQLKSPDLLAVFYPRLHSITPCFSSRHFCSLHISSLCFTSPVQSSPDFSNLDDDVISLPWSFSSSAQEEFR